MNVITFVFYPRGYSFCGMLGGGFIEYSCPKLKFAGFTLAELLPWDWERISIIYNCILHYICIKAFSYSLDCLFSSLKYSTNSFVGLLTTNLLKALTALFKSLFLPLVLIFYNGSNLVWLTGLFDCEKFWRISFFCFSASCSNFFFYFSFFFAFFLFWC